MFSQEQEAEMVGMVHQGGMTGFEAAVLTLLAEMRDSMARLVELAESDYAGEVGPAPRSLGDR